MNKVYPDAAAALAGLLRDGMTIMAGGFGLCGIPEALIAAIRAFGRHAASPSSRTMPGSTAPGSASCSKPGRSRR